MLGGNLLKLHRAYLPILVNKNYLLGCAIINGSKKILLYNPLEKKSEKVVILINMLLLVCDKFRRSGNYSDTEVGEFQKE